MEIVLIRCIECINDMFRICLEPLVVLLILLAVLAFTEFRKSIRNKEAFYFLFFSFVFIFLIRFILASAVRMELTVRYFAPVLIFILVLIGPVLLIGTRKTASCFKLKKTEYWSNVFLILTIVLILSYSVLKTVKNSSVNHKVEVWKQIAVRQFSEEHDSLLVFDWSGHAIQLLYAAGVSNADIIRMFPEPSSCCFCEFLRKKEAFRNKSSWYMILPEEELEHFRSDFISYAGNFPFSVTNMGYHYILLHYHNENTCFSGEPQEEHPITNIEPMNKKHFSAPVKILFVGDALFSSTSIPEQMKEISDSVEILNFTHGYEKTPYLQENTGWRFLKKKSPLSIENTIWSGVSPDIILISSGLSDLYTEEVEFIQNVHKSLDAMELFLTELSSRFQNAEILLVSPLSPPEHAEQFSQIAVGHREFTCAYTEFLFEKIKKMNLPNVSVMKLKEQGTIYSTDKLLMIKHNYMSAISEETAGNCAMQIARFAQLPLRNP